MNDSSSTNEMMPAPVGNRRAFLARAAAFGTIPLAAILLVSRQRPDTPSSSRSSASAATVYQFNKFAPLIGTEFSVAVDGRPAYSLTLSKVEALKQHQPGVAERFSLRFTAPEDHPFQSRIYQLRHPTLGCVDLFISPVGSSVLYGEPSKGEAVINNMPRPA